MPLPVIICDIDGTICKDLTNPIAEALEMLARVGSSFEIHYVTGRPDELRKETVQFLMDHSFPNAENLHLCSGGTCSRIHKVETIQRLAKQYKVVASIGDSLEEELASDMAGIPFIRVDQGAPGQGWKKIAEVTAEE